MTELLNVHFLSSNVRNCFFYLSDSNLRKRKSNSQCIKIQFGENHTETAYASISLTPMSEVPENCIGVAPGLANKWNLKENELVLVSYCAVDSIHTAEILPLKEEDYMILVSCKSLLESHILNQVSVVAEEQILPLYVFSNISIDVRIGKLNLHSKYGRLEKFTELVVLHSVEKSCDKSKEVYKTGNQKLCFNQLQEMMTNNLKSVKTRAQKEEIYLKHLIENDTVNYLIYKIQPSFLWNWEIPEQFKKRSIVVSNFKSIKSFGPCCVKTLGKVEKLERKKNDSDEKDENIKKKSVTLNIYIISLNWSQDMIAFCPAYVMEKLNAFCGSNIIIEPIKRSSIISVSEYIEPVKSYKKGCFWNSMAKIRNDAMQTIFNNIKYNLKINTLIVGEPGMGKSFLFDDIAEELASKFIFCKTVCCKSLRGKKIETLHKIFSDTMRMCCSVEFSVLILDDLQCLTSIDAEEGQYNKLFSERVVDLITEIIKGFQRKFNISIVASATNISELSSFISAHGPRLFQNVLTVPEMTFDDKQFMLKNIIFQKTQIPKEKLIKLDLLLNQMNGFTIQDLNDLTDKAVFNSLMRNEFEEISSNLDESDFDLALSELTPLNLRDVKLKDKIDKKWEDVGGLKEPKKILSEIFSWPLEYPELLESCPLRLQRGVLLYGAPGTGKTLLAGALANKCGLNFISVKGPEVLSKYVGASEEGVRNLFIRAQKTKPCLLFFDEFDSLAPKRGHDSTGVTDRVVNQLLTQLDGVEALNGVWVLAATSRPDLLDIALLRPGRLDKMVFCDLPNEADRLLILEALSRNLPKASDVDFVNIAEKSEGYTGADLQAVLYNSQMLRIKENCSSSEPKISQKHLLEALSATKPSLSLFERVKYEKLYEKFLHSRRKNYEQNYNEKQRVTLA